MRYPSAVRGAVNGIMKIAPRPLDMRLHGVARRALTSLGPRLTCRTVFGARMRCDNRDYVQSHILQFGVWEPDITASMHYLLKAGATFIDVGANVGYHTLLAVGAGMRVVSIEACPTTAALLRENLALNNNCESVRVVEKAAGDRVGTVDLFMPDESNLGMASTVAGRGGEKVARVEMLPLQDILTHEEKRTAQAIKIDVEGAESPIIRDLAANLDQYPNLEAIWVETDDINAVKGLRGFDPFVLPRENLRRHLRYNGSGEIRPIDFASGQQDFLLLRANPRPIPVERKQRSSVF